VVRYVIASPISVKIQVNTQAEVSTTCNARTNRVSVVTHVGQGPLGTFPFEGDIAGLFAVDAALTTAQTAAILARMRAGQDTLSSCEFCGAGLTAPRGAVGAAACVTACNAGANFIPDTTTCECSPGFTGPAAACEACAAGEYKALPGDEACDLCAAGTASAATAARIFACPPCPAGQIQIQAGQTACVDCPADTYREMESSASLQTDCARCRDFSTSLPGATLETTCLCNAGFFSSNAICTACDAGSYTAAGDG